jgi:hypothetical protein
VVKLDVTGEPKRVKFHYMKTYIQSDEWIDVESPRIALLHTKAAVPTKKVPKEKTESKTVGVEKRTAGEEFSTEESESVTSAPLKDDDPPTLSIGPSEAPTKSPPRKGKKSSSNRPRLKKLKSRRPLDEDSDASSEDCFPPREDDEQQTSEKKHPEGGGAPISKEVSNTVTDESSPDDSLRTQTSAKAKPKSNAWTIPKKKRAPAKVGLELLDNPSPIKSQESTLSDKNGTAKSERSAQSRRKQEPDFQIARKTPRETTAPMQSISEFNNELDDGTELGEICSPARSPERPQAGSGYDYHNREGELRGASQGRHHHAGPGVDYDREDRGCYSRLADDVDRPARGGHGHTLGESWEDDRRDRKSYTTSYDDGRKDDRSHGRREEDRPGGCSYESQRKPYDYDYGEDRHSDDRHGDHAHANRAYSSRPHSAEDYDERRHHAGDYEIPHDSNRSYHRSDGYYDDRNRTYESRNIFQDNDPRYDDGRTHDCKGHRGEDYQSHRDHRYTPRDNYRGDTSSRFERAPGATPDSSPSKARRYRHSDDISSRFEPAPGASPDSLSSKDRRYHHNRNH